MDNLTYLFIFTLFCFIEAQIAIALSVWALVKKQNEKIVKEEVAYHVLGEVPSEESSEDDNNETTNYNLLKILKKEELFDTARRIDL